METPVQVKHEAEQSRLALSVDDASGVLEYRRDGDLLSVLHTGVDPSLRGRGLAQLLTEAMLEFVRREGLALQPVCSYTAAYLKRHPQADLKIVD